MTAFVALAPERVKAGDFSSMLLLFSIPLGLFFVAVGTAVVECPVAPIAMDLGLGSLFIVFLIAVLRLAERSAADQAVAGSRTDAAK